MFSGTINRPTISGGNNGGACSNLSGIASPLNSVTPDFIGQVYVQSDGTIWQAGSLLSSSWVVIAVDGLAWGPLSATADEMQDDDLNNNMFNGSTAYTRLSFGNPVTINNGINMSGSPWEFLEYRNLVTLNGGFGGDGMLNLTELRFPNLVSIDSNVSVTGCPNLVTLHFPMLLPTNGVGLFFNDDALDAASVNHILARCVAAAVTTCTIDLSGGTNAAPTGQGIVDSAALTLAGNTVSTN